VKQLEDLIMASAVELEAMKLAWKEIADAGGKIINGIQVTSGEANVAIGILELSITKLLALKLAAETMDSSKE
jgi:hypothetical protein